MELIINGRFLTQNITGVQRYAHELVRALDNILSTRPEFRITVMSPRLSGPSPSWRNIKLRQVGYLQGHAWEQLELPLHSRGKTLLCTGNTAPIVSLLGAQPVIVTVHDLSYRYFPDAYNWSFRLWYSVMVPLILNYADTVITVSESERAAILAYYPKAEPRLRVIQNGGLPADFDFEPMAVTDGDSGYILYVGSLSKRKNFQGAFEAACRLARERNFRFIFVGGVSGGISVNTPKIPSELRSLIEFTGQINDPSALVSLYKNAACFMFPSFYEASPLPPIEAMGCGCPVIASDIPSLRERCEYAAHYCDPHDTRSISAAVERVMDDRHLRTKLKELGYARASVFTWQRCACETLGAICKFVRQEAATHGAAKSRVS
jgi:glycosyltransferase involved in cell wall biosynthesis